MASTTQNEGRFHCLKCGRKHNRSSDIGAFHHHGLDVEREGFQPVTVAVGIAFVRATDDRRHPRATIDEIEAAFETLGFAEQFPTVDVEETISAWKDVGLIGDERHTGKHWFVFLANRRTPRHAERSPRSLHNWMKRFSSELDRARSR